ncbi:MAG: methyltransferase domain-containing protein [Acidobacteria bacterium]|nr:methyltransferase domain-containing protein [Acidobacteriota bacterium]
MTFHENAHNDANPMTGVKDRRHPTLIRLSLLFTMIVIVPGTAGVLFSLSKAGHLNLPEASGGIVALAAYIVALMTIANIGLRWLRWHYLVRRAGVRLATRESVLFYMATLPTLLTPFSVGELIRALLLGRRYPSLRLDIVAVWVLERASDFLVVVSLVALYLNEWTFLPAAVAVWCIAALSIGAWWKKRNSANRLHTAALAGLLAVTFGIWILPGFALWSATVSLGPTLPFGVALGDFVKSTFMGELSGSPTGIGIADSSLIALLTGQGFSPDYAGFVTELFRGCSTWFAVSLGACVALLFVRRLTKTLRPFQTAEHFEELAPSYAAELPFHLRKRLLERKTAIMCRWLDREETPLFARGLDFGCGQGWYTCKMAERGYRMTGLDLSEGQIREARAYAVDCHSDVQFEQIEGTVLPYDDATFDFVYAINVLHHVMDTTQRDMILKQLVRVLKPGGVFFLQEFNPANIVFRLYISYLYPLIRGIDEGTELWIHPDRPPPVDGAQWQTERDYITFLPDFLPAFLTRTMEPVERWLEQSALRRWSAHYMIRLVKDGEQTEFKPGHS